MTYRGNTGVHLTHCYQGEYAHTCKYGDKDCPAKRENELILPHKREFTSDEIAQIVSEQGVKPLTDFDALAMQPDERDSWREGFVEPTLEQVKGIGIPALPFDFAGWSLS